MCRLQVEINLNDQSKIVRVYAFIFVCYGIIFVLLN
jgi:hypothetical protein